MEVEVVRLIVGGGGDGVRGCSRVGVVSVMTAAPFTQRSPNFAAKTIRHYAGFAS